MTLIPAPYSPAENIRYHALRAQAAYLRNPNRTDGPSKYEAEEVAAALDAEADTLSESLFYAGAARAARAFTPLCSV